MVKEKFGSIEVIEVWPRKTAMVGLLKKLILSGEIGGGICHLCGEKIEKSELSSEHVPPKQFFPKHIRSQKNLSLQTIPAHKKCNESYREDEEYFYHRFYPLVLEENPNIGNILSKDFKRKSKKPQTPAMFRRVLTEVSNITPRGIHLPADKVVHTIDRSRVDRVILKITQGLYYIEKGNFLPLRCAEDVRLCLNEDDVPELYKISWKGTGSLKGIYPEIFSYRYFTHQDYEYDLWSLMFYKSFMFCAAFKNLQFKG